MLQNLWSMVMECHQNLCAMYEVNPVGCEIYFALIMVFFGILWCIYGWQLNNLVKMFRKRKASKSK